MAVRAGNGRVKGSASGIPGAASELTQAELESRLWAAANSLRGPVDPADFKAYIFPLLFFKRISDTWDEEHARAVADFGTDLTSGIEADYHRFAIPEGCHWRDLRRVVENVGVALQNALDRIQEANPDTLAGIFGDVAWANKEKLPEHALLNLVEAFNTLDLRPGRVGHDVLGNAYEYLLKQFADESGKKAGEFFTPRPVVRLLTRILDPQPTDTVYDPAIGSGGMLVEAANEVIEAGGSLRQMRFFGQEVNLTTSAIARMNLFLHDIEDAKVRRGDTLRDPKFLDVAGRLDRFDVVIANPPFSLKKWGAEAWAHDPFGRAIWGLPPGRTGDYAWIQHMVCSMKPGIGRVGVVMPHGVLFRPGQEKTIRQSMVESGLLDMVIGLPPKLFYNTIIRACLLVFRAVPRRPGQLLMVDASLAYEKGKQNVLLAEHIDSILRATSDPGAATPPLTARWVTHDEILERNWSLALSRYLDVASEVEYDPVLALGDLADAERASLAARGRLSRALQELGLGGDTGE
jgi:type I restriction enzyme M protein